MNSVESSRRPRPLLALALLLLGPLLLGCLAAPVVFNAMPRLAETFSGVQFLQNAEFERVSSRCVMIFALFLLYPAVRLAGMTQTIGAALSPGADRTKDLAWALVLAFASMTVLYLGGWAVGAFYPDPDTTTELLSGRVLSLLVGATIIGVFEEAFFRGFIFGSLRQRWSLPAAAVAASLFFSILHFMRPAAPAPIEHASWHEGFSLLPYLFERFHPAKDWSSMLTLFLMGLALCGFYEKRRNLYLVIGLHGGWVFAMQTATEFLDRAGVVHPFLFGRSVLISKAPIAIPLILLFVFFAFRGARSRAP